MQIILKIIFFLILNSMIFLTKKKDGFFSPKPDFYFCQGKKYYDKLKKIYKKKFTIGSLKNEFDQSLKLFKTSKEYKK